MMKGKIISLLVLSSLFIILPVYNQPVLKEFESEANNIQSLEPHTAIKGVTGYTIHEPIEILNNSAFGTSGYNFPGGGTVSNPYQITGYNITDSSKPLIYIENTTAYFVIQDCHLDGINKVHDGIYLRNVTLGTISHNILSNVHWSCYLYRSLNNVIENNRMSNSSDATIVLDRSGGNGVFDNEIQNSAGNGISIGPYSGSTQIFRNTITDIASNGITVGADSQADIINNTLSDIGGYGMLLNWHVQNNKINGNIISNTSLASIYLSDTAGTANYWRGAIISNNTILNSKQQGILFGTRNRGIPITRNTIVNCAGYGIEINTNSNDTEVRWNNFFHNNGGSTQAFDDGTNNVFEYNHWNNHVAPDVDVNGIVDIPYRINNNGLYFDGVNDYADLTDFTVSENFTIELWINPTDADDGQCIIGKHTSEGGNLFLIFIGGGSNLIIYNATTHWVSLGEITPGWQHLAIIVESNATHMNYQCYKNGKFFSSNSQAGVPGDWTGRPWTLGQDWDSGPSTSDFFYGIMDEIRILNGTLTAAQILEDCISPTTHYPARASTVVWYHLNETSGTLIKDYSGNGNDGTTINGATWGDEVVNLDLFPRVAPIWIDSNDDFLNFSSSGTGTSFDPYIIENQHFMSNQTTLVEIRNSDAHFEIRNSVFDGLNGSNNLIYLDDVNNGRILNNTICNTANNAIWIQGRSNNTKVSGNNIYDCGRGIRLIGSGSNNIVSENRIYNLVAAHGSGITVDYEAYSNTITGNIIFGSWTYNNRMHGIVVGQSANQNIFSVNTIYNCSYNGFYIATSAHHNTYSENNISHCGGYGIFTWQGTHNDTFSNNIIYNTSTGIALDNSSDNLLIGNVISDSSTDGIAMSTSSNNNTLTRNAISDASDNGISLSSSNNNTLLLNVISDCTTYGVNLVYSNKCLVTRNNFVNNNPLGTAQAYDNGSENNVSFNYWSTHTSPDSDGDGIVDPPYYLDPYYIANQDFYPRTTPTPSLIIISPHAGNFLSSLITVTLDGVAPLFWYYIEGIDAQNQTWTVSTDRTIADGTHTLHVYSIEGDGTITHDSVTFTIDTTPPVITITSPTNTTYSQNSITLTYTVSDGTFTLYIDNVVDTTASGSVVSSLTDGVHNVTIVAVDALGNTGKTTVIFTVDTTLTTTTTTVTITTSTSPSDTSKTATPTTNKSGSFPGIIVILSFATILVVIMRRCKRT